MSKAEYKVSELVAMVQRGGLQLPEMQRSYVWSATRVRDLLDSLYRGYPSGIILAWETDEDVATNDFAVSASQTAIRPLLLLDGQQRITSLSAVLRGEPVTVKGRTRPVEILFNLEHPKELTFITEVNEASSSDIVEDDEVESSDSDIVKRLNKLTFVVASKILESSPNWVKVSDIFKKDDGAILQKTGIVSLDDPRYAKYSSRLKAVRNIEDYVYRAEILERSKSYEEVTEIFVRVNSLGAKLRSSDLALAQITAKWRGSLELFQEYENEIKQNGFDIELSIILRTLVSILTGQSKFNTVSSLSKEQLEYGWAKTKKAVDFATNFLRENVGIDSAQLLSSPFFFVTVAYWVNKLDYTIPENEANSFKRWLLIANAKGRYSRGSSETLLNQDLVILRDGGDSNELVERLRSQVGLLSFTTNELKGKTSRSGAFKTMFLLFQQNDVRDWATNLVISTKHQGKSDAIEYHHIFPKAFMKKVREDLELRLIDDIANLAFIGSKTNKDISAKSPNTYRNSYPVEQLEKQLIDFGVVADKDGVQKNLDLPENWELFIERRRSQIADALNKFLEVE